MKSKIKQRLKGIIRPIYFIIKDTLNLKSTKVVKQNIKLKDKYLGARCFVLATGEPLSYISLIELRSEYTIGISGITLHNDFKSLDLSFYIDTEPLNAPFFKNRSCFEDFKLPNKELPRQKRYYDYLDRELGNNGTILFLNADNYNYINRSNYFSNSEKYYLRYSNRINQQIQDIDNRYLGGGGTIFNSLEVMLYLGFKEIYLLGAGYTYQPTFYLHFYDNHIFQGNLSKKEAFNLAKNSINNSVDNDKLIVKDVVLMNGEWRSVCVNKHTMASYLKKHKIMKKKAENYNAQIINVVPDGFLSPVYKSISWNKVKKIVNKK